MVRGLLHGWTEASNNLGFKFAEETILRDVSIEQFMKLYEIANEPEEGELRALRTFLANRQIKRVIDLRADDDEWRTCEELIPQVRSTCQAGVAEFKRFYSKVVNKGKPSEWSIRESIFYFLFFE